MRKSGYSSNIHTGMLRPEVEPITLFYTIFHEKGTPFVYLLLTNGTPFIQLFQNLASLLTAVNALSFKQELIKYRTFSRLYKAIKFICQPFWALLQTQMTDFPTLLNTSASEIPTLSYTRSLKKVPLSGGASPYGPLQGVPSPKRTPSKDEKIVLFPKVSVLDPVLTTTKNKIQFGVGKRFENFCNHQFFVLQPCSHLGQGWSCS